MSDVECVHNLAQSPSQPVSHRCAADSPPYRESESGYWKVCSKYPHRHKLVPLLAALAIHGGDLSSMPQPLPPACAHSATTRRPRTSLPNRDPLAPSLAARLQHFFTACAAHTRAKAMRALSRQTLRLVRALRHAELPSVKTTTSIGICECWVNERPLAPTL